MFEELTPHPNGAEVLDNSRMAADSVNARKAIESPTPTATTELVEKHAEFPFPVETHVAEKAHSMPNDKLALAAMGKQERPASAALTLSLMEKASTITSPTSNPSTNPGSTASASLATKPKLASPTLKLTSPTPTLAPPDLKHNSPSLLLVDDNKINLTLLRTYMRKRAYTTIDEAENGLDAVSKFNAREQGYDIVFMDISMPVLDGFGATRQIRSIEEARRRKGAELAKDPGGDEKAGDGNEGTGKGEGDKVKKHGGSEAALIIALTGLASSRDQSEAFTSGVDLFLTKPVAFREVGKMLDNWEANREREVQGSASPSSSSAAASASNEKAEGKESGGT